ncbi:hypothetical protein [Mangrovibacterium marinum]|uniref:Uncharacterized protein n=1 Tax=Mangrovibacterium marinum TaxID=1639118 RepID=A0A2T5C0N2_9BACT|nr:hypothetical protein [Mangrovibacterium marinum]PTN08175.1 hypothetical protein C8N47_11061 [Mangrovibacterium marinum]
MLTDLTNIIIDGLQLLNRLHLLKVILGALLLAVLCWFICSWYTKLWNKSFQVSTKHHLLCALSALLTFFFVLAFVGIRNLRPVAEATVEKWSSALRENGQWQDQTFKDAYDALKNTGWEDFSEVPSPDQADAYLPCSKESSMILTANLYAEKACLDFSKKHSFLDMILPSESRISKEIIKNDMDNYFRSKGEFYPIPRAVELASVQIRDELLKKTPRVVFLGRTMLIILFLLIQLIPLGIIGYCAYKNLKIANK